MSPLLIRLALLSHLKCLVLVSVNLAIVMYILAEEVIKASLQTCFYAKLHSSPHALPGIYRNYLHNNLPSWPKGINPRDENLDRN